MNSIDNYILLECGIWNDGRGKICCLKKSKFRIVKLNEIKDREFMNFDVVEGLE